MIVYWTIWGSIVILNVKQLQNKKSLCEDDERYNDSWDGELQLK